MEELTWRLQLEKRIKVVYFRVCEKMFRSFDIFFILQLFNHGLYLVLLFDPVFCQLQLVLFIDFLFEIFEILVLLVLIYLLILFSGFSTLHNATLILLIVYLYTFDHHGCRPTWKRQRAKK